jgi:hypothetical protein
VDHVLLSPSFHRDVVRWPPALLPDPPKQVLTLAAALSVTLGRRG